MIKCYTCAFHKDDGKKHTCDKTPNITAYGKLFETIRLECCSYKPDEKEQRRRDLDYWLKIDHSRTI